jgi:hypothetical protein
MVTRASVVKNQAYKKTSRQVLSIEPFEIGFHFYTSIGKYTGITANSLSEFAEKLQTIAIKSIIFHLGRDDFQGWLRGVINDEELAHWFDKYKQLPSWASNKTLRKDLANAVNSRINELVPLL